MKVKICGMKYERNIAEVSALSPDFMGFIFYPKSKRFVGLDFERQHIQNIDPRIRKVAVFVNAHVNEVVEFSRIYGISTVQLHGDESPEFCTEIKKEGFSIIKAFGVDENFDFESLKAFEDVVDFFLFDTKTINYGGSGKTFGWDILNKYQLSKPFFLSGGLDVENLEKARELNHSQLYAVDLNSKFEIEPGIKNVELLEKALKNIRE
ncbi:Phosphoribosylanthranilate isomerase [Pseudopedobacter saltans DSM 12145]|uniref:N-(5'-phosphoribosyl)anthranilate isomerase n=1 Tax=Pseudopedobacter saltans (strain ATCC 51119 / DSM 12145 / JCM 21818 / CCUG 39354 / LMG 10337 / NBRC 100064 / NCIMB 13643) TaxID=762903 RepID=F0S4H2_PSESL|nr:phosphoribosylanthranilate isomerase [Pseudopedobacter saltans]ADY51963.1 Phosphoribosylanthranilate isomerase [Pseudopedobacter saltans DSM 12145]